MIEKNKCTVFKNIKSNAMKNIKELSDYWNIYEKQRFFTSAIGIYDRLFLVYSEQASLDAKDYLYSKIINYSYPVFIKQFYDEEFQELPGIVLKPMDKEYLSLYSKLIYSCGIIGWMQYLIDNVNLGYYNCYSIGNIIKLSHNYKYHWNEIVESGYIKWYSDTVAEFQKDTYALLFERFPEKLEKMKDDVFVWKKHYMGYNNDIETESFFREFALLDAQQATEWDMFPENSVFGNMTYNNIVETIIDFEGYSIKHSHYARIFANQHSGILLENILPSFILETDLIKLIEKNRLISKEESQSILRMISYDGVGSQYYNNTTAAAAPLIKISKTQYIRSIKGCLDRPFEYALANIKKNYQKEWSANSNLREVKFRKELFAFFERNNFICIDRPVIIKDKRGNVITDVDAIIVDKDMKQIAVFQLKWQDHTDSSLYELNSKAKNYYNKTEKWEKVVHEWIKTSSCQEIAQQFNIKKDLVNKEEIYVFVIGRRHGNYSGNQKRDSKCAYAQWYQTVNFGAYLSQNNKLTIKELYMYLVKSNPTNRRIKEKRYSLKYDKFRISIRGII